MTGGALTARPAMNEPKSVLDHIAFYCVPAMIQPASVVVSLGIAATTESSPMSKMLVAYVAVLVPFLALDAIWLWLMSSALYKPILGDILRTQPNLWPAAIFYALYPIGLLIFAVWPAVEAGQLSRAIVLGLLFGLFTYATYDLTNHATLRSWTTALTVSDMTWGSVLAGVSATCSFIIVRRVFGL